MTQLALDFDAPASAADPPRRRTIGERFEEWDRANPQVYEEFKAIARRLRDAGHRHYGSKSIVEILRYHRALETRGDEFKLNNVYTPYLARKLMAECPEEFGEFFETRAVQADTGND